MDRPGMAQRPGRGSLRRDEQWMDGTGHAEKIFWSPGHFERTGPEDVLHGLY